MKFKATHIINDNDEFIEVMLIDGAAYTRSEFEAESRADYERQEDGSWTFQGQAFAGSVRVVR